MKPIQFITAVLCTLLLGTGAFAQSLAEVEAREASSDTARIRLYCTISFDYLNSKIDSALYFANEALRISQNGNDNEGISRSLNAVGNVLLYTGQHEKALETYLMALKKAELAKADKRIAQSYANIGNLYLTRGYYRLPLVYFEKAKKINEKNSDFDQLIINYVNSGVCYQYLDMPDSALFFLNIALNIAHQKKMDDLESPILLYIGNVFVDKKNLPAAKSFFIRSMAKAKITENKSTLSSALLSIGNIYKNTQVDSSLVYAKSAYEIASENKYNLTTLNAASALYEIFLAKNKLDSSLKYLKIKYDLKEEIFNGEKTKQIENLTIQEQFRQMSIAADLEQQKKTRMQNIQYLGITAFIISLFAFLILLSRRKIKPKIIEYLGLIALLIFFEFIAILLHPLIEKWSHHKPIVALLILVCIASVLVPCHHYLEKWIKNKLTKK